jgi:hypothetical protein
MRQFFELNGRVQRAVMIALLLLAPSVHAVQTATSGMIGPLRTNSATWGGATLADVTVLQLSTSFANGCAWVYIAADDHNLLAVALAAKASGTPVIIWYDNTVTSPWGDTTTCLAEVIQQN